MSLLKRIAQRLKQHNQRLPDTAESAIRLLGEQSSLNMQGAKAQRDPSVEGVWKVTLPEGAAVVYLPGYPDPWGKVREQFDFEFSPQ